jgi:FixJ family two-component response regulator
LSDFTNTVYVVDPDPAISEAITTLLGTYDLQVSGFLDAETFLDFRAVEKLNRGCVMIEVNLPGLNGLALLRQLRAEDADLPIIILTNAHEPAMHRQAVRFGADRVVEKPLINDMLTYTVMNVLREFRHKNLLLGTH